MHELVQKAHQLNDDNAKKENPLSTSKFVKPVSKIHRRQASEEQKAFELLSEDSEDYEQPYDSSEDSESVSDLEPEEKKSGDSPSQLNAESTVEGQDSQEESWESCEEFEEK